MDSHRKEIIEKLPSRVVIEITPEGYEVKLFAANGMQMARMHADVVTRRFSTHNRFDIMDQVEDEACEFEDILEGIDEMFSDAGSIAINMYRLKDVYINS